MLKFVSSLLTIILCLIFLTSCGGGSPEPIQKSTTQSSIPKTGNPGNQSLSSAIQSNTQATISGTLRNEKWFTGVWESNVPKTDTSFFAGNKIILNISDVKLLSNEKVQGNPTGKYSYSGSLVWKNANEERVILFNKENELTGDNTLVWSYLSPGANQYTEQISLRVYDQIWQFELDWGPQISRTGSTLKSFGMSGSIENLETSEKDQLEPGNPIDFKQINSDVPEVSIPAASTPEQHSTTEPSSGQTSTVSTKPASGQTGGDIWKDIPLYPGSQRAEDQGFSLSIPDDPNYSLIEWRFYASTDDYPNVVDFYEKQMPANGWKKMMWMESEEMSWGSFEKNDQARIAAVYIIKTDEGAGINIQNATK